MEVNDILSLPLQGDMIGLLLHITICTIGRVPKRAYTRSNSYFFTTTLFTTEFL